MIVPIVPIVPVVSKNVQTIGTIIWKRYPDDRKRPGRLRRPRSLGTSCVLSRRSGRSCKFCSDQMETLSDDWSPWHQVFEEILCLQGTLLASQCRKIKRKSGYQGTRFALRIKIIHLCGLFAKHAQKFYCLTQRHRWRPRVSCLWGDRDDHMDTTNRPSRLAWISSDYFESLLLPQ